jgi:hypothetical protein
MNFAPVRPISPELAYHGRQYYHAIWAPFLRVREDSEAFLP